MKANEFDISFDEQKANSRTDKDEYFVDLITENMWDYSNSGFLCNECYKWHSYDCYGATEYANYMVGDGYIVCKDCLKESEEYMRIYLDTLINKYDHANILLSRKELEDLGFERFMPDMWSYANGMYNRADNPKTIMERAIANNPDKEFIFFMIKDYNPFETQFDLYAREVA